MNSARLSLAFKAGTFLILSALIQSMLFCASAAETTLRPTAKNPGAAPGAGQADYKIGMQYLRGEGVRTNYALAAESFRKAAEAGNTPAQTELGVLYENGWGVPRDITNAALCYRIAAEAADVEGCYRLGLCYHNGSGMESNTAKAAKWFRTAAEAGHPRAQSQLGSMLFFGDGGLRQDQAEAVKWYRKSALQGDRRAMNNLSFCLEAGCGVDASQDEAAEWCLKAATLGDDIAQTRLGLHFIDGAWPGVPVNPSTGLEFLRKAAEQTNITAMTALAHCYESGTGVKRSRQTAKEWYNKACDMGGVGKISGIVFEYLMNAESIQDYPDAIRWLDRAAAAGQSDACLMLAGFYGNAMEDIDLKALLQEQGLFDKVKAAYLFMQADRGQYFPGETSASNQFAEAAQLAPAYTNAARFLMYDSKKISSAMKRQFHNNTLPPELESIGAAMVLATNPPGSVMIDKQIVSQGTVTTNANGAVVTEINLFGDDIPQEAIDLMPELSNATIYRPAVTRPTNSVGNAPVIIFH